MTFKISIVTIFRNEEKHIAATIRSILQQSYQDFECILVDGRSTDRSASIIREETKDDPRFTIITQKSKGISNAFNEGVALVKGQAVLFLNAGDMLASPKSLEIMKNAAIASPQAIHCFKGQYMAENGTHLQEFIPRQKIFNAASLLWSCDVCHQATLIPLAAFSSLGGYSPSYEIAMDYDWWLRAYAKGFAFIGHGEVLALHRKGGISGTLIAKSRLEVVAARMVNFGIIRRSFFKDLIQLSMVMVEGLRRRRPVLNKVVP